MRLSPVAPSESLPVPGSRFACETVRQAWNMRNDVNARLVEHLPGVRQKAVLTFDLIARRMTTVGRTSPVSRACVEAPPHLPRSHVRLGGEPRPGVPDFLIGATKTPKRPQGHPTGRLKVASFASRLA
jgi:hypothetical protein